jgi:hypothetical protein
MKRIALSVLVLAAVSSLVSAEFVTPPAKPVITAEQCAGLTKAIAQVDNAADKTAQQVALLVVLASMAKGEQATKLFIASNSLVNTIATYRTELKQFNGAMIDCGR